MEAATPEDEQTQPNRKKEKQHADLFLIDEKKIVRDFIEFRIMSEIDDRK